MKQKKLSKYKIISIISVIVLLILLVHLSDNEKYETDLSKIEIVNGEFSHDVRLFDYSIIDNIEKHLKEKYVWVDLFGNLKWPEKDTIDNRKKFEKVSFNEYLSTRVETISSVTYTSLFWIKEIIKEKYIPEDIEKKLIILQERDPRKSRVICRYKKNGLFIQIVISNHCLNILITPVDKYFDFYEDKKKKRVNNTAFIKDFFRYSYEIPFQKVENLRGMKSIYCINSENVSGMQWKRQLKWYVHKDFIGIYVPKAGQSRFQTQRSKWF